MFHHGSSMKMTVLRQKGIRRGPMSWKILALSTLMLIPFHRVCTKLSKTFEISTGAHLTKTKH